MVNLTGATVGCSNEVKNIRQTIPDALGPHRRARCRQVTIFGRLSRNQFQLVLFSQESNSPRVLSMASSSMAPPVNIYLVVMKRCQGNYLTESADKAVGISLLNCILFVKAA